MEFTRVRRNEHSSDFCFYMVGAKNFPGDKISGLGFFLLPSGKKQIQMLTIKKTEVFGSLFLVLVVQKQI